MIAIRLEIADVPLELANLPVLVQPDVGSSPGFKMFEAYIKQTS